MKLFDQTLATLQHALDVRLLRQHVLAGNVANADTPGYRAREVDFAAAMEAAARAAATGADVEEALARSPDVVFTVDGGSPGFDGNTVDLDQALVALGENALQYGAAARAAGKKLAILRYVASDGNA